VAVFSTTAYARGVAVQVCEQSFVQLFFTYQTAVFFYQRGGGLVMRAGISAAVFFYAPVL